MRSPGHRESSVCFILSFRVPFDVCGPCSTHWDLVFIGSDFSWRLRFLCANENRKYCRPRFIECIRGGGGGYFKTDYFNNTGIAKLLQKISVTVFSDMDNYVSFNWFWLSDAIWWHRSGLTLAQIMACCLTAPSHNLNQCWLTIKCVLWHLPESNFTGSSHELNP